MFNVHIFNILLQCSISLSFIALFIRQVINLSSLLAASLLVYTVLDLASLALHWRPHTLSLIHTLLIFPNLNHLLVFNKQYLYWFSHRVIYGLLLRVPYNLLNVRLGGTLWKHTFLFRFIGNRWISRLRINVRGTRFLIFGNDWFCGNTNLLSFLFNGLFSLRLQIFSLIVFDIFGNESVMLQNGLLLIFLDWWSLAFRLLELTL